MAKSKNERIYLDPKLNTLPDYYDRDIVKVLTKNLKEVYAFWGISSSSLEKILNAFKCKKEDVYFKLIVNYMQEDKVRRHKEIFLPPFTNNWFLQFEKRIKNLKVEVLAYNQDGHTYSLLHSAEISIPSNKPSQVLHKDWLKASWIQKFNMVEINGELHIKEGEKKVVTEHKKEEVPVGTTEIQDQWEETYFTWSDGSSGFMGSSGILASSSNHLRKSHEQ